MPVSDRALTRDALSEEALSRDALSPSSTARGRDALSTPARGGDALGAEPPAPPLPIPEAELGRAVGTRAWWLPAERFLEPLEGKGPFGGIGRFYRHISVERLLLVDFEVNGSDLKPEHRGALDYFLREVSGREAQYGRQVDFEDPFAFVVGQEHGLAVELRRTGPSDTLRHIVDHGFELGSSQVSIQGIVGQASETGPEAGNLVLSEDRAQSVREALSRAGYTPPPEARVQGVGSADPLLGPGRGEERFHRNAEVVVVRVSTMALLLDSRAVEGVVEDEAARAQGAQSVEDLRRVAGEIGLDTRGDAAQLRTKIDFYLRAIALLGENALLLLANERSVVEGLVPPLAGADGEEGLWALPDLQDQVIQEHCATRNFPNLTQKATLLLLPLVTYLLRGRSAEAALRRAALEWAELEREHYSGTCIQTADHTKPARIMADQQLWSHVTPLYRHSYNQAPASAEDVFSQVAAEGSSAPRRQSVEPRYRERLEYLRGLEDQMRPMLPRLHLGEMRWYADNEPLREQAERIVRRALR